MTGTWIAELLPIFPELLLCLSGLMLLAVGVYGGNNGTASVNVMCVWVALAAMVLLCITAPEEKILLGGMLRVGLFTQFVKGLILVAVMIVLTLTAPWLEEENNKRFEYPILVLFATVGMMLLVSANNLLTLYLALELMSLALYVLAAFDRDSLRSTEAGLKYFVLGSLASGMLLFGTTLVYGFAGSTDFADLARLFQQGADNVAVGTMVGLILILIGMCFKVSAVPFHMWTPDVYEGAPTPVTAFFATAPKIAAITIFARLLIEPFGMLTEVWQQVIIFVSVGSMIVGSLGALVQTNIKRLLAYSSIGHAGYMLMGLAAGTVAGIEGVLIYLAIYLAMSAGAFGCVLLMRRRGKAVEDIGELSGIAQSHPYLAFALATFMFSMAGIPPLAGFFGKFYVFMAAIKSGLIVLAVIGVLTSVIACYYYLKLVKIMYFDAPREPFEKEMAAPLRFVLAVCGVFTLLFCLMPSALTQSAKAAAESIFL